MLTDEQLAEWERLAAGATRGPWHAVESQGWRGIVGEGNLDTVEITTDPWPTDLAFIAAARTAVPALVAEVRRLRALATLLRGGEAKAFAYVSNAVSVERKACAMIAERWGNDDAAAEIRERAALTQPWDKEGGDADG